MTAEELRDRQETVVALAEAALETMRDDLAAPPDGVTLAAYLSVYTRGMKRDRARRVAETFADEYPAAFPNARAERHVVSMLARRGDLEGCRDALADASPEAAADVHVLGTVLDAHARKGDLDRSLRFAEALAAAHTMRAATGVGASNRQPDVPVVLRDAVDMLDAPHADKRRGPPERFLVNFRRLCRVHNHPQPDDLPPDPVLWRQQGSDLRRSKKGHKDLARKRAYLRVGK